jgi:hypothetical protein
MELNKNSREIYNKFRCPICLETRLRGSYVTTKKGPLKDIELKTCNTESCIAAAKAGAWSELLFKLVIPAILLVFVSACGQAPSQPTVTGLAEKNISSAWLPHPNPTQPAVLPFNGVDLTQALPETLTTVASIASDGTACQSVVDLHGDQTEGTFELSAARGQPASCGTTTQEVTYQRIGTQNMEFCIGTECGLFQ